MSIEIFFTYHLKAPTISNKLVLNISAQMKGKKSYDSYKYVFKFRRFQVESPLNGCKASYLSSWLYNQLLQNLITGYSYQSEIMMCSQMLMRIIHLKGIILIDNPKFAREEGSFNTA